MKLTIDELTQLIPDYEIKEIFLARNYIAILSKDEQEIKWQEHLVKLNKLRELFSTLNCIVIN